MCEVFGFWDFRSAGKKVQNYQQTGQALGDLDKLWKVHMESEWKAHGKYFLGGHATHCARPGRLSAQWVLSL
jgi:hypothetical protein